MKKTIVLCALLVSAGCTSEKQTQPVGMPNPASAYCVESGGRLEIRKDADGGDIGYCHLPGGRVVEEWELFRQAHGRNGNG